MIGFVYWGKFIEKSSLVRLSNFTTITYDNQWPITEGKHGTTDKHGFGDGLNEWPELSEFVSCYS